MYFIDACMFCFVSTRDSPNFAASMVFLFHVMIWLFHLHFPDRRVWIRSIQPYHIHRRVTLYSIRRVPRTAFETGIRGLLLHLIHQLSVLRSHLFNLPFYIDVKCLMHHLKGALSCDFWTNISINITASAYGFFSSNYQVTIFLILQLDQVFYINYD